MPSYDGAGLVNLMAEIEARLGGSPKAPGLDEALPESPTYVLVLFDGLGVAQLAHPGARAFSASQSSTLTCGFPSTTSTSLSTIATGLPPSQHGTIGHLVYRDDLDKVVNTLKWMDLTGQPVAFEYRSVLPELNLWERLRAGGVEPITVQPGGFQGSPLSRALYRGARFEAAWDWTDLVDATVTLAAEPNRFIFTYVPFVDVAGHSFGLESPEFGEAMKVAASIWDGIVAAVAPSVQVVGTADHGLLAVADESKLRVLDRDHLRFAGDSRVLQVWGTNAHSIVDELGGTAIDGLAMLGPNPSQETLGRAPQTWIHAPTGSGLYPPAFDRRLHAYHGGLSTAEMEIPLLLA